MTKLKIPILLGTARKDRRSKSVAKYVHRLAVEYGFDTEIVDVRDYMSLQTIPPWQNKGEIKTWAEIMNAADGLIIVSPEYNHGYPGEFKIVFDQLFEEYRRKPVAICSVSDGNWGGTRVIEQLWLVSIAAFLVPTGKYVQFPKVQDLFDASGQIIDHSYDKRVKRLLAEMEWFAKTLQDGRSRYLSRKFIS